MKKILFALVISIWPFLIVNANEVNNVKMDIYIDQNGNATVTETWDAFFDEDTEIYHSYTNIVGNSEFVLESVTMDGQQFEIIDDWQISGSLSDKAYKAGLYYPSYDSVDVSAGITSYGNHSYTFKYKINNFILGTSDADLIYWELFSKSNVSPKNIYIKIHSDIYYSKKIPVWGYGNYGGTAYVYDGYIEMSSEGKLDSDEYMSILVKFPKDTFSTTNITSNNFDYYFDLAEEGAGHYKNTKTFSFLDFFIAILMLGGMGAIGFLAVVPFIPKEVYKYGSKGSIVKDDVPLFRDIPCNKNLFDAYFICNKYSLINKKENLLGAVLLKWVKDGNVRIHSITKETLFNNSKKSNIIFVNKANLTKQEGYLYDWMYEASKDGILEDKEFEKWCKNNPKTITNWFDDVINEETMMFIDKGLIVPEEKKFLKFIDVTHYKLDDSFMTEAEKLKGLKNFLKEFSIIDKREPIEVALWSYYLIYAQIFGIAKEVAKQFKKLYPEINAQIELTGLDYDSITFVSSFSNDVISTIDKANDYSAGGRGFSSSGGGGGASGSGGSAGTR